MYLYICSELRMELQMGQKIPHCGCGIVSITRSLRGRTFMLNKYQCIIGR